MRCLCLLTISCRFGGINFLHFFKGNGLDQLTGHADSIIMLIGSYKADIDVSTGNGCVDLDRRGVGILEFEIHRTPIDGCITARLHISNRVHMRLAFNDLQICGQCAHIHGRYDLTNAAAFFQLALTAISIDNSFFIAFFYRSFTDNVIERKHFSRSQHRSINGIAGQSQIGGSVGIVGVGAAVGGEHIGVIFIVVLLHGDSRFHDRQLNFQHIAFIRQCDLSIDRNDIKPIAYHFRHQFLLSRIIVGIARRSAVLIIVRLQIHDIIRINIIGIGNIGHISCGICIQNRFIKMICIQFPAIIA